VSQSREDAADWFKGGRDYRSVGSGNKPFEQRLSKQRLSKHIDFPALGVSHLDQHLNLAFGGRFFGRWVPM
jgi:hypothetical protein